VCAGCILCQKWLKLSRKVDECKPLAGGADAGPGRDCELHPVQPHGRAVQIDSMKPKLKPPETKCVETEV